MIVTADCQLDGEMPVGGSVRAFLGRITGVGTTLPRVGSISGDSMGLKRERNARPPFLLAGS